MGDGGDGNNMPNQELKSGSEPVNQSQGSNEEKGEELRVYGRTRSGEWEAGSHLDKDGFIVRDIEEDMTREKWGEIKRNVPVVGTDLLGNAQFGTYAELNAAHEKDEIFGEGVLNAEETLYPKDRREADNAAALVRQANRADMNSHRRDGIALAESLIPNTDPEIHVHGSEVTVLAGNKPEVIDRLRNTINLLNRKQLELSTQFLEHGDFELARLKEELIWAKELIDSTEASGSFTEQAASEYIENFVKLSFLPETRIIRVSSTEEARRRIEEKVQLLVEKGFMKLGDKNAEMIAESLSRDTFNSIGEGQGQRTGNGDLGNQTLYDRTVQLIELLPSIAKTTGMSEEWLSGKLSFVVGRGMILFADKGDTRKIMSLYTTYNNRFEISDKSKVDLNKMYANSLERAASALISRGRADEALRVWDLVSRAQALSDVQRVQFEKSFLESVENSFFDGAKDSDLRSMLALYDSYLNNDEENGSIFGQIRFEFIKRSIEERIHSGIFNYLTNKEPGEMSKVKDKMEILQNHPGFDYSVIEAVKSDYSKRAGALVSAIRGESNQVVPKVNFYIVQLYENGLITKERYEDLNKQLVEITESGKKQ